MARCSIESLANTIASASVAPPSLTLRIANFLTSYSYFINRSHVGPHAIVGFASPMR